MKPGFIAGIMRPIRSHHNGNTQRLQVLRRHIGLSSRLLRSVWWQYSRDNDVILLVDYMPQISTIMGQYYERIVCKLHSAIIQKHWSKLNKVLMTTHLCILCVLHTTLYEPPICSCLVAHHIHHTLQLAIIISFVISRNICMEGCVLEVMNCSHLLRSGSVHMTKNWTQWTLSHCQKHGINAVN